MKNNCGIVALDKLLDKLNLPSEKISLYTLSRIALDNDILLYPLKIPKNQMNSLLYPIIVYNDEHFEVWSEFDNEKIADLPYQVYILSSNCIPHYIVDMIHAQDIKGSRGGAPSYENFTSDIPHNLGLAQDWFDWAQQQSQYNQYLQPTDWDYLKNSLLSVVGQDPYYGGLGTSYASQYIPGYTSSNVPGVGLTQAVENYLGQKIAATPSTTTANIGSIAGTQVPYTQTSAFGQTPVLNAEQFLSEQGKGGGFRKPPNFFESLMSGGGYGGLGGSLLSLALAPFTAGTSLAFMPLMAAAGGVIQGGSESGHLLDYLKGGLTGFGVGGVGAGLAGALGLVGAGGAGTSGALSLGGTPGWGGMMSGLSGYTSAIPGFGVGGALSGLNPFLTGASTASSSPLSSLLNLSEANAFGSPVTLGGTPYSILSGASGLTGIPGGSLLSNMALSVPGAGATGGGSMDTGFWNLANLFKNKKATDFLPSAVSLLQLLGSSSPEMPATPNVQWPMANQGDVQSALANYQNLMQPTQDYQYQQYQKQLRPVAAQQGWLDSSYYVNMLSDYLQGQNALTQSQIPGILSQQYGTNAQMAQLQYALQLEQYMKQLEQKQNLWGGLGQNIMGLFG